MLSRQPQSLGWIWPAREESISRLRTLPHPRIRLPPFATERTQHGDVERPSYSLLFLAYTARTLAISLVRRNTIFFVYSHTHFFSSFLFHPLLPSPSFIPQHVRVRAPQTYTRNPASCCTNGLRKEAISETTSILLFFSQTNKNLTTFFTLVYIILQPPLSQSFIVIT